MENRFTFHLCCRKSIFLSLCAKLGQDTLNLWYSKSSFSHFVAQRSDLLTRVLLCVKLLVYVIVFSFCHRKPRYFVIVAQRTELLSLKANSHMSCRAPAILRQCRVLRESPRGRRKKPKAGRSPTCRLWTADANSYIPCSTHFAPMPRCVVAWEVAFITACSWQWHGKVRARHDMCESNTATLGKSNGKDTI
jgi:hypothetical protein